MINQKSVQLGSVRSVIRELFEYGKKRKAQIGEDNVFDFSLGNPSVPPPAQVEEALENVLKTRDPVQVHGYTSAQGDASVRSAIAGYISKNYGVPQTADLIYMTCGAAGCFARHNVQRPSQCGRRGHNHSAILPRIQGVLRACGRRPRARKGGGGHLSARYRRSQGCHHAKDKGGAHKFPQQSYSEERITQLCKVLKECKERGQTIYLIADEPYRELVFGGVKVPYIMNYYDESIVCYSFSKSLSLPGERIGYIAIAPDMRNAGEVYAAVCGAGRALGYVCAPALFQLIIPKVLGLTADISVYERNRDTLSAALESYGFTVVRPDGAFYLFVQSPEPDSDAFAERAKEHELLIVSAKSFGVEGYVRISYCVSPEMIARSLPAFRALALSYGLKSNKK